MNNSKESRTERGDELKNRIAVVTGAGSGLGRSIAAGLSRAGAIVGLLDIDTKSAGQTQAIVKKELPQAQTMVITCDVTNETDVDKAFGALLKEWGDLDILVNTAGVAPAGPLVDMPVDKWRAACEVNLTGYFLMARAAARIMIKQGKGGSI
jgi:NAD(P)-dependent dehydrogenase (short-subunit alcohol dehydrogenase family)